MICHFLNALVDFWACVPPSLLCTNLVNDFCFFGGNHSFLLHLTYNLQFACLFVCRYVMPIKVVVDDDYYDVCLCTEGTPSFVVPVQQQTTSCYSCESHYNTKHAGRRREYSSINISPDLLLQVRTNHALLHLKDATEGNQYHEEKVFMLHFSLP